MKFEVETLDQWNRLASAVRSEENYLLEKKMSKTKGYILIDKEEYKAGNGVTKDENKTYVTWLDALSELRRTRGIV